MIIQKVECLEILTMQETERDLTEMKVEKEGKLYVTNATTLEILQGIVEHLMISAMEEIEEMYLYSNYVITLET